MTRRQRRRLVITALIWLVVASALSAVYLGSDDLDPMQARATDALFFYPRQLAPEPSQYVVLVAIDDKSIVELKQYGRFFGWPRTLYADVMRQLADARARTIVFDVLFDVPTDDDSELWQPPSMMRLGRATFVVQPSFGGCARPSTAYKPLIHGRASRGVSSPLPTLAGRWQRLGMATQDPDADGTVRRVPLVFDVNGEPYPGLPLIAVSPSFLRRPTAWDGPIVNNRIPLAWPRDPD